VDLTTQTAGLQFGLGLGQFEGLALPDDIAVMPGSPGTVAVSKLNGGTLLFDDGVARAQGSNSGGQVEFGSPTRLYVGSGPIQKLDVTASGLTQLASYLTVTNGTSQFVNNLLYFSGGGVIDPETGEIKGRYGPSGFDSGTMAVDVALGRVF